MSYLSWPRMHFSGRFQSDPSTVNNDPTHYNSLTFLPRYQEATKGKVMNGWWNPKGTGAFRLVDCKVWSFYRENGEYVNDKSKSPVIGMVIADSGERAEAKMVDLDPQNQVVSEIWGLVVRLVSQQGDELFRGEFKVVGFTDIWTQEIGSDGGDSTLGAMYQSQLSNLTWGNIKGIPFLEELKAASNDGLLSIKFNVNQYQTNRKAPDFTLGKITGTIGPASKEEPARFVLGRHLAPPSSVSSGFPANPNDGFPTSPNGYMFATAQVNQSVGKVCLDLGNSMAVPAAGAQSGPPADLELLVQTHDGPYSLGKIPNADPNWLYETAGVADLPSDRALTPGEIDMVNNFPLVLQLTENGKKSQVLLESDTGLYVRSDAFIFRLNPEETAKATFFATKFGKRLPNAGIEVSQYGPAFVPEPSPYTGNVMQPPMGTPTSALTWEESNMVTDGDGKAVLTICAGDPGNPRAYIDGQVYYMLYQLKALQGNSSYVSDPSNTISLLIWDRFETDGPPAWYKDIQPIMQQYANLYPVMGQILDLGNYYDNLKYKKLLELAFGLPKSDPNYMPVTRDLSADKQKAILAWYQTKGPDGKPFQWKERLYKDQAAFDEGNSAD